MRLHTNSRWHDAADAFALHGFAELHHVRSLSLSLTRGQWDKLQPRASSATAVARRSGRYTTHPRLAARAHICAPECTEVPLRSTDLGLHAKKHTRGSVIWRETTHAGAG